MKIAKPLLSMLFITATHSAYAQQAHVNLDWNPQKNGENLTPFMANLISPEVRHECDDSC